MASPTAAHPVSCAWACRQAAPRKGFLTKPADTREIDLDTSALLLASGQLTDVVFFQQVGQQGRLGPAGGHEDRFAREDSGDYGAWDV
ncbi:hypothetical protein ACFYSJ_36245 [Streptomyces sp. NPDC005248]|uniref:hypothetical protein n=1 Tax=Streptomyces sp. NPDC005248 TaxID=3364709 RepID=UPI0036C62027